MEGALPAVEAGLGAILIEEYLLTEGGGALRDGGGTEGRGFELKVVSLKSKNASARDLNIPYAFFPRHRV